MKETIASIIDKLNIQIILLGLWILSLMGIIIPQKIIKSMGLLKIKEQNQWIISLIFLTLCAYYIALLLIKMKSEIFTKLQNRKLKKYFPKVLRQLSNEEIRILFFFYDEKEKRFGLEAKLDIQNATVNVLSSKMIISRGSSMGNLYEGFSYYLQRGALEELNKMLVSGDIKIEGDEYEWLTYG